MALVACFMGAGGTAHADGEVPPTTATTVPGATPLQTVQGGDAWFGTASGRGVFWRGEQVILALRWPGETPIQLEIGLARTSSTAIGSSRAVATASSATAAQPRTIYAGELQPVHGVLALNLALPTDRLGGGDYRVEAKVGGETVVTTFRLVDTVARSPGMRLDENHGPALASNSELAGLTGFVHLVDSDAIGKRLRVSQRDLNTRYDAYARLGLLAWTQDATRLFGLAPPHSADDTQGEYLRRMVLLNSVLRRYPAHAGQIYDYDPTGYVDRLPLLTGLRDWGKQLPAITTRIEGQERALRAAFTQATGGMVAPTRDELLRLAAALGDAEMMDNTELPPHRWARSMAALPLALPPDELAALQERVRAWYAFLIDLPQLRYTSYQQALHRLEPTLANSSSNTLNHNALRDGNYPPANYGPLDFRFMSVWNAAAGLPEQPLESLFAASLLAADRQPGQPLWVDTQQGEQNGYFFRNALLLGLFGAQGSGYADAVTNSMANEDRGGQYLRRNSNYNQEVAASRQLAERFGGLWQAAQPLNRVGLLLSRRQAAMTPRNYDTGATFYRMFYLLCHLGLPPRIVTEEALERGQLGGDLQSLVVLGQHERLSAAAEAQLADFAGRGGRVLADSATTVPWSFVTRATELDLPLATPGDPLNLHAPANPLDLDGMSLQALVDERSPALRTLFATEREALALSANVPSRGTDEPDLIVAEARGGEAIFVGVGNDRRLNLAQCFTAEERNSPWYRDLYTRAGNDTLSSWLPLVATLQVRHIAPNGRAPAVYDLLNGSGPLRVESPDLLPGAPAPSIFTCDLRSLPARLYALYPRSVGPGALRVDRPLATGNPLRLTYTATDVFGEPMPAVVPVEVRLTSARFGGNEPLQLFRATDASGVLRLELPGDAVSEAGSYTLTVRQLLDGQGIDLPLQLDDGGNRPQATPQSPVVVRDPEAIRRFLADTQPVFIPVFDESLRPQAERLAEALRQRGRNVTVVTNPLTLDYDLIHPHDGSTASAQLAVDTGDAFGKVLLPNDVAQSEANPYGTSIPGYRYGRTTILLGLPESNPVLDALRESGLLWRDLAPPVPASALVQVVPLALSPLHDTLVVDAADLDGLAAGIGAVLDPPTTDPVLDGVRRARSNRLRGYGITVAGYAVNTDATANGAATQNGDADEAAASLTTLAWNPPRLEMAPVSNVETRDDGTTLLELGRWSDRIVMLDAKLRPTLLPVLGGRHALEIGRTLFVTGTPQFTIAWSIADGRPVWKAVGMFAGFMPDSDLALIQAGSNRYLVDRDGVANAYADGLPPITGKRPNYAPNLKLEHNGQSNGLQSATAELLHVPTNEPIIGLPLTVRRSGRRTLDIEEIIRQGDDAQAVAVLRRFFDSNKAYLFNQNGARLYILSLNSRYLTDIDLSTDENLVALCDMEGDVLITDLVGVPVGSLNTSAFPMITPRPSGGFFVTTADGGFFAIDAEARLMEALDLTALPSPLGTDALYELIRQVPLVRWHHSPDLAGTLPLERFERLVLDANGKASFIDFQPARAQMDLRWADRVEIAGTATVERATPFTLVVRAAGRSLAAEPLGPPEWQPMMRLRHAWQAAHPEALTDAPGFRVYLDGQRIGDLTLDAAGLKPFTPAVTPKSYFQLDAPPESLSRFTGQLTLTPGPHRLALEPVNLQDCIIDKVDIR